SKISLMNKFSIKPSALPADLRGPALGAVLLAVSLAYVRFGLGAPLLRGDALTYWRMSSLTTTVFNVWWGPGFPAAGALLRSVTYDLLPPAAVMVALSGSAYLIGAYAVGRLSGELGVPDRLAVVLLYLVFPFVGIAYTVLPVADSPVVALLILTCLAYERKDW